MSQFNGDWGQIKNSTSTLCRGGAFRVGSLCTRGSLLSICYLDELSTGCCASQGYRGYASLDSRGKGKVGTSRLIGWDRSARPPRGTHPIGYGGSPITIVDTKCGTNSLVGWDRSARPPRGTHPIGYGGFQFLEVNRRQPISDSGEHWDFARREQSTFDAPCISSGRPTEFPSATMALLWPFHLLQYVLFAFCHTSSTASALHDVHWSKLRIVLFFDIAGLTQAMAHNLQQWRVPMRKSVMTRHHGSAQGQCKEDRTRKSPLFIV